MILIHLCTYFRYILYIILVSREVARVDVPNDEEALDDLGRNADLYIFHQDIADSQQVNDVRTGCQLLH